MQLKPDKKISPIRLADRDIGPDNPCFIIAEIGVNHDGSVETAKQLVDAAAAAGADAVKLQTFKAEKLATSEAPMATYQENNTSSSVPQVEMLRKMELSNAEHRDLMEYSEVRNLLFLSSPFDKGSAEFLGELGIPGLKVASGEITNIGLLEVIARIGKPLIMSTGMATLSEVQLALEVVLKAGAKEIALLHCVSDYPVLPVDANLRAMDTMKEAFALPVGYSDHTLGIEVALAAVALGACIIEKHFTLDRSREGPDHAASLEPEELKRLVYGIRTVEAALGHGRKEPTANEQSTARAARRSLVAAHDLPAGSSITHKSLIARRPGTGLPPTMTDRVVGRTTRRNIPAGTLISWDQLI